MEQIIKRSSIIVFFFAFSQLASAQNFVDEVITIDVEKGKLLGRLMAPKGKYDTPVMIIVAGSGPTDMNGNSGAMFVNNSLLQLAEMLADNGISSIRFDKRGQGESKSSKIP